jgi:uncharacterized protein YjbI with pentapeptide repeats
MTRIMTRRARYVALPMALCALLSAACSSNGTPKVAATTIAKPHPRSASTATTTVLVDTAPPSTSNVAPGTCDAPAQRAVDWRGCDLRGRILKGAMLASADLRDADLTGADLSGADLGSANLHAAHLSFANLEGASATSADLSDADLTGANLTGVKMANAFMLRVDLAGASATNADLSNTILYFGDLHDADMTGANLRGAQIGTYGEPDVANAMLQGVIWSNTTCPVGPGNSDQDGGTCVGNL